MVYFWSCWGALAVAMYCVACLAVAGELVQAPFVEEDAEPAWYVDITRSMGRG
jgi:hypothetical protein